MADMQDLIVIGAGSGGFAAAMRAVQLGAKVTLIEGDHHGGNCMNRACIPSKVLMSAARLVSTIGTAQAFGIQVGKPLVDLDVLHERKDLIIEGLRMGTEQLLSERGIHLLEGRARLTAPDAVEVNGELVRGRNIILATGSVAAQQPIEGADLPGVLGTEDAMELRDIPGSIAILGSQPWDVELAQYFHALGSRVTVIEGGAQLLPGADRELAQRLGKLFHDAGITIKRNVAVQAIRQADDGALVVILAGGKGEVLVDRVLAARRLPNSNGLGLRELGLRMQQGAVLVDEQMRTNFATIFAVGDLARPLALPAGSMWSHQANAEGIVAAEVAMGTASKMDYSSVPRCLYTWPEVAWVGLTEDDAEVKGMDVAIGKVPTAINPYAMILGETAGMIKIVASKRYGKILGAHIMAPGAVELINTVTVAMLSEATVGELMRFIPAHPAIGETLVDAALDVEKRSLHLPDW